MQCNFCKDDQKTPARYLEADKKERVVNPVCWEHRGKIDGRYVLFPFPFWSEKKDPTPPQVERHQEYLAMTWNMPLLNPQVMGLKLRPMVGNRAR